MQAIIKDSILQVYKTTSVNGARGIGADLSNWKLVASVKLKGNISNVFQLVKFSPTMMQMKNSETVIRAQWC